MLTATTRELFIFDTGLPDLQTLLHAVSINNHAGEPAVSCNGERGEANR